MDWLTVSIVRFVDTYQPGIVECEFEDADGKVHKLVEKVPCVSTEDLWIDSLYPQPGQAECIVRQRWTDPAGRVLALIDVNDFLQNSMAVVLQVTVLESQLNQSQSS